MLANTRRRGQRARRLSSGNSGWLRRRSGARLALEVHRRRSRLLGRGRPARRGRRGCGVRAGRVGSPAGSARHDVDRRDGIRRREEHARPRRARGARRRPTAASPGGPGNRVRRGRAVGPGPAAARRPHTARRRIRRCASPSWRRRASRREPAPSPGIPRRCSHRGWPAHARPGRSGRIRSRAAARQHRFHVGAVRAANALTSANSASCAVT